MQHLDNSITTFTERTKLGIRRYSSRQGHGQPNPTWIPVGNEVTRRIAAKIDGVAAGTWGELFNIPLTAHFLGGAAIATAPGPVSSTRISGCTAIPRCRTNARRRASPTAGSPRSRRRTRWFPPTRRGRCVGCRPN
jgi:hypothetical protein